MDNRVATWDDLLGELAQAYSTSQALGGAEAIGRLHGRGKLTARERLELLFDPGTFHEIGLLAEGLISVSGRAPRAVPADAVVTGWGRVDGRIVFAIADDGTIAAGARGVIGGRKAGFIRSLAQRTRHPLVQLSTLR